MLYQTPPQVTHPFLSKRELIPLHLRYSKDHGIVMYSLEMIDLWIIVFSINIFLLKDLYYEKCDFFKEYS